jgi:uncharacterized protein (TIRG00374 family)
MTTPASPDLAAPAPSRRIWWILGWCVLAVFFAIAAFALPWKEVMAALAGAKWQWVALAVVVIVAGWPLWILQWWLLAPAAHRPSFARMAQVTALTGTANTSLPIAGVVAAVGFLIARGRLPATAAASLYAVDQLLTGLAKVGVLILAAWLIPIPDWLRAGLLTLSGVMVLFTVALLAAAHGGELIHRVATRLTGRPAQFVHHFADFVAHLEPMRSPLLGLSTTVLAFAKKAVEVLSILIIQVAVGIEPSIASAVLVTAALSLATMAPISPGHIGVYEATVIFCYQFMGVPLPLAAAAAFLQHGAGFISSFAGIGYLAWALPRDDRGGRRL